MLNPSMNRGRLSRTTGILTTLVAMCFLIPFAALRLPAQEASGALAGTIHDPSGAPVKNATVIMTNQRYQKSNAITMTVSDTAGNFVFKALPSGEYEMRVEKKGFEPYRVPRVVLERGRRASQSITLGNRNKGAAGTFWRGSTVRENSQQGDAYLSRGSEGGWNSRDRDSSRDHWNGGPAIVAAYHERAD